MKPQYEHDCDHCTFLGKYRDADLYYCPQGGNITTVIARFSDTPWDYASGLSAYMCDVYLLEARSRAIAQGLLKG